MDKANRAIGKAVNKALYPVDTGAMVLLAFYAGMACALILAWVTTLEVEARRRSAALDAVRVSADGFQATVAAHLSDTLESERGAKPRAKPASKAVEAKRVPIERGEEVATHD